MLITDQFVMLNLPKTGSTFARTVVKELYARRLGKRARWDVILQKLFPHKRLTYEEILLPKIKVIGVAREPDQHGTHSQIPNKYQNRTVVSIVRNPYSRFISDYKFRFWEKYPPTNNTIIFEHFPHFPDLTLDDYVKLDELDVIYGRFNGKKPNARVGAQTVQFIQMFFKNPQSILEHLTDEYLDSDRIFDDMADIVFLRQESLNDDLSNFLLNIGFTNEETAYVQSRERVNITKASHPNRDILWTPRSLTYIRENERMLFRILESKGIVYKEPQLNNLKIDHIIWCRSCLLCT